MEREVFTKTLTPAVLAGTDQRPTQTGCEFGGSTTCNTALSGGYSFDWNGASYELQTVRRTGNRLYVQFIGTANYDALKKLSLIVNPPFDNAVRLELSELTTGSPNYARHHTFDFDKSWGGRTCEAGTYLFADGTQSRHSPCATYNWKGNEVKLFLYEDLRIECTPEQYKAGSNQCNVNTPWSRGEPGAYQGQYLGGEGSPPDNDAQEQIAEVSASFEKVPDGHDGSSFTFNVRFSEPLGASYSRTMRAQALDVSNGVVKDVRQIEGGLWRIKIKPDSKQEDVGITLEGERDCDDPNAICTIYGTPLSNTSSAEVPALNILEKPGQVTNFHISTTPDSLTVSWSAPASGGDPDRYIVQLKPADGGKGKIKRLKVSKTSVTFRNLEAGATYNIRVRAENKAGKGNNLAANMPLPTEQPQYQVQEEPTATPIPEPTATPTPIPVPTATPTPEPEPTATPEPTAVPGSTDDPYKEKEAWKRYDTDNSGDIDHDEYMVAVYDYTAGKISYLELLSVVRNMR